MNLEITFRAQKKFVPSVDSTGKRLTQDEINAIASSSFTGSVDIEVRSGSVEIIAFRGAVIAGTKGNFFSMPSTKGANGYTPCFQLGEQLQEAINKGALRTMREAIQGPGFAKAKVTL